MALLHKPQVLLRAWVTLRYCISKIRGCLPSAQCYHRTHRDFLLKALHENHLTDAGFPETNSVASYMCTCVCTLTCVYTCTHAYFQAWVKIYTTLKTKWATFQSWQISSSNPPCTYQGRSPKRTALWQPASPHTPSPPFHPSPCPWRCKNPKTWGAQTQSLPLVKSVVSGEYDISRSLQNFYSSCKGLRS